MAYAEGCERWKGTARGTEDVLFHFGAVDAIQSTVYARPVLSLGHTLSTRHYIFWPFTTTGRWQSWGLSAGR